jgi:hypothetical protein
MLDNYNINEDSLIYQDKKEPFIYDIQYVKDRYDTYGELNNYISHLRLGYILGSINEPINSILDIGYGNGAFLKTCKKSISNCYGFDVTNYNVPEGITFVNDWLNQEADVVTFFDVLEHFEDPYIIKNLKTKYIVISVPWCHYTSDEWFKNWKHRRPNEHLWFFNEKSIHNFAEAIGCKVLNYKNLEDVIRSSMDGLENILTFTLQKK